jgi:hypothetical protein
MCKLVGYEKFRSSRIGVGCDGFFPLRLCHVTQELRSLGFGDGCIGQRANRCLYVRAGLIANWFLAVRFRRLPVASRDVCERLHGTW